MRIYVDEGVEVYDSGGGYVNVKMWGWLLKSLIKTAGRAGVSLTHLLMEIAKYGDLMFDEEIRGYMSRRIVEKIVDGKRWNQAINSSQKHLKL
jgi:hypothetical protein